MGHCRLAPTRCRVAAGRGDVATGHLSIEMGRGDVATGRGDVEMTHLSVEMGRGDGVMMLCKLAALHCNVIA